MKAEQGQQYRIIGPQTAACNGNQDYQSPQRFGQGPRRDRYRSTFRSRAGSTLVLEDVYGDVVYASDNVAYPRGANEQYRNVKWIEEHPERFELIEE